MWPHSPPSVAGFAVIGYHRHIRAIFLHHGHPHPGVRQKGSSTTCSTAAAGSSVPYYPRSPQRSVKLKTTCSTASRFPKESTSTPVRMLDVMSFGQ